jgi:hypothetical protein
MQRPDELYATAPNRRERKRGSHTLTRITQSVTCSGIGDLTPVAPDIETATSTPAQSGLSTVS